MFLDSAQEAGLYKKPKLLPNKEYYSRPSSALRDDTLPGLNQYDSLNKFSSINRSSAARLSYEDFAEQRKLKYVPWDPKKKETVDERFEFYMKKLDIEEAIEEERKKKKKMPMTAHPSPKASMNNFNNIRKGSVTIANIEASTFNQVKQAKNNS